ncbi:MAG: PD40 domain-containing protein [Acidobacteria bacterium]|nr:PD40 domain-containing protein [Acidobacteriota bacterium]MBV9478627.1 PD40 domain-containing protein [Acidobacteriota bacterium]
MKTSLLLLATLALAPLAAAQTDINTTLNANQAAQVVRIAVPFPELVPPSAPVAPEPVNSEEVRNGFFGPLTRDIAYSGIFAIAPLPPSVPVNTELLKRINAQLLLRLNVWKEGDDYVVEARLVDQAGSTQLGKRYRSPAPALGRTAHMLANELVRTLNGRPGVFLSQIAFASNRTGNWEIWLMDWDGSNQRRITFHNALSILPSWSPDNERMVYTSFARGTSDMYIINRRGGGRMRINSGLALNTSATFSPVGDDIAFVGSVHGNPDIYLIKDDGSNIRRLTTTGSVESTPEWSPNGRQIAFTSGRSGTPQIYVMDAEGTNVRRISYDGNWNDDAVFSPDGEKLAYTSRVNGRFQIRIANLITNESRIVAGEGSNEQPTWSPDGNWISFQSNRSGAWQVYRMRIDGTDLLQLTFDGENKEPDWSKKPE